MPPAAPPLEASDARLAAGRLRPVPVRRVGEYDVLASLGRGGAGEVFLALRRGPHQFRKLVVLKLLHEHFEDDPKVVEMFLDEARLAGRLDHPGIAQTLEVGVSEGRHYIVMGFLEGIGLDRLLAALGARGRTVPPALAAWVTAEVLSALHYAHQLRDHDGSPLEVVHRDVSPSNIFLCWDGTVKLIDFGIAKAAIRRANTDSGIIKGKWGYIAPEHATGEGTDRRADVWSAGVVLWEMLTGKRLFPNLNDVTTLQALVAGELQSLSENAPDTPEPIARVVDGALQHDPDDRYPTAAAMGKELRVFLAGLSQPVRPEDLAELLGEVFGGERERQQALLADLVGGALAVSRTGSFGVSDAEPAAPEALPVPRGRVGGGWRLPLLLAAAAVATLTMIGVGGLLEDDDAPTRDAVEGRPASPTPSEGPPARPPVPAPRIEPPAPTIAVEPVAEAPAPEAPRSAPLEPSTLEAQPAERVANGYLTLDTIPWSRVRLGNRVLGNTPLDDLELPPGEHVLELENTERGLRRTYRVTVRSGEHTHRRIPLQ